LAVLDRHRFRWKRRWNPQREDPIEEDIEEKKECNPKNCNADANVVFHARKEPQKDSKTEWKN
jgi:hypothetical protein